VIKRRIRAVLRKYKLTGLAFISVLGLTSVFAVNLAGFLILLPRSLWGLLDAAFFTSYLMRLSILLAFAILASRYSVYTASSALGVIYWPVLIGLLLTKKAGRRFIRIKGYESTFHIAKALLKRHDNEVKYGNDKFNFEDLVRRIFSSNFARSAVGLFYIMGHAQGKVDSQVGYFAIPIQLLAIVVVLSALFTTLTGSILLVTVEIVLFL
jgi:hypothetical protein